LLREIGEIHGFGKVDPFLPLNGLALLKEKDAWLSLDLVLTIGEQRIPLEVKYRRRIDYRDAIGLRAFVDKPYYNAPFGVLVTLTDEVASDDPRIISIPMSTLLLLR